MSYIPDMKDLGYRRVAVGWLHPDHTFPTGKAAPEFLARLTEFSRRWGKSIETLALAPRVALPATEASVILREGLPVFFSKKKLPGERTVNQIVPRIKHKNFLAAVGSLNPNAGSIPLTEPLVGDVE